MECTEGLISINIKINLLPCLERIQPVVQELWSPKKRPRVPTGNGMKTLGLSTYVVS